MFITSIVLFIIGVSIITHRLSYNAGFKDGVEEAQYCAESIAHEVISKNILSPDKSFAAKVFFDLTLEETLHQD